ncbi:MAG: LacI family DNA-binding transcriptional regulator [Chloroflexi bacterium]|nr:LacI family DNA-binding transcriptional regulator [Chloroflexota bacterium]MBI1856179.1 LacI family DNA-binding transcriptional regulator [Chloroflexota bacterium]MBI3339738.1 LacI family DNA-binding transcriptional regulator [Chloroflexota bacterium]
MSPKKKTQTIYDVAELAGVSISTVSRVMNTPNKVNKGTHTKVLGAIEKLGFIPKAEARARALRQTGRIGVLTPFFTAPSFVQRLRGVAAALSKSNYDLVIYTVDSSDRLQGYISSIPLTGNLDGLIIMSLPIRDKDAQYLSEHGVETVLIEYPNPKLNSIEINDVHGGQLAAEYLIQKGYKRIAFLGDTEPREEFAIHPASKRLVGFQRALQDAGIHLPKKYISHAPNTPEHSLKAAQQLLGLAEPPTAIFAAADIQALSVLKAARGLGLSVPSQLAVIGFDDIDIAEYADLTTIRQHLDESGKMAVEILLTRIANSNRPLQHVQLPLSIVERLTA